jgi:AraC family transcriptional regulator
MPPDKTKPANALAVSPPEIARRRTDSWRGVRVETFEPLCLTPFSFRATPQHHLLMVNERGERLDGETVVDGFARSNRRSIGHTINIVPAGCTLDGWTVPRTVSRSFHFSFDPNWPLIDPACRPLGARMVPRLHMQSLAIEKTAYRLKGLIGSRDAIDRLCSEALGMVLACEILRLADVAIPVQHVKGGLSPSNARRVQDYIEAHIAEDLSLPACARVASLSVFHFAHAFKQTFGMPPHSYVIKRRVERAKERLAAGTESITEIAVDLGFYDAGAFAKRFRDVTGLSPSAYRHKSR